MDKIYLMSVVENKIEPSLVVPGSVLMGAIARDLLKPTTVFSTCQYRYFLRDFLWI